MTLINAIQALVGIVSVAAFLGTIVTSGRTLRKLSAEADHLRASDVQIYTATATGLVETLRSDAQAARIEAKAAKEPG